MWVPSNTKKALKFNNQSILAHVFHEELFDFFVNYELSVHPFFSSTEVTLFRSHRFGQLIFQKYYMKALLKLVTESEESNPKK